MTFEIGLTDQLLGTARWRREKAELYPGDERNVQAAGMLENLARDETAERASKTLAEVEDLHKSILADNATVYQLGEAGPDHDWRERLKNVGFGYSPKTAEQLVNDHLDAVRLEYLEP